MAPSAFSAWVEYRRKVGEEKNPSWRRGVTASRSGPRRRREEERREEEEEREEEQARLEAVRRRRYSTFSFFKGAFCQLYQFSHAAPFVPDA